MVSTLKVDTRIALLEAGRNIMFEKGYNSTGIQEVLNCAAVPKGSFYHYFDSKEDFALKIIEYTDRVCNSEKMATLEDESVSGKERLLRYCLNTKEAFSDSACRKGCFIGNLSQEMADQSEILRKALSEIMSKWKNLIAQCIEDAQKDKEITNIWPANKMAELFLCGWEGAIMRAKTLKSLQPLDDFIDLIFNYILTTK